MKIPMPLLISSGYRLTRPKCGRYRIRGYIGTGRAGSERPSLYPPGLKTPAEYMEALRAWFRISLDQVTLRDLNAKGDLTPLSEMRSPFPNGEGGLIRHSTH